MLQLCGMSCDTRRSDHLLVADARLRLQGQLREVLQMHLVIPTREVEGQLRLHAWSALMRLPRRFDTREQSLQFGVSTVSDHGATLSAFRVATHQYSQIAWRQGRHRRLRTEGCEGVAVRSFH